MFSKEKYLGFFCKDDIRLNIPQEYENIRPKRIFDKNILKEDDNKFEILDTNIFEEYSKFLRQEENKWEQVKELLNL